MKRSKASREATILHQLFPPIDLHADTLMWARWIGYDMTRRHRGLPGTLSRMSHVDLPRLAEGGLGAQFFGLVSLPVSGHGGCNAAVHEQIGILDDIQVDRPDLLRKATSADEIDACWNSGILAALLGIEGAHALEGSIANLDHFARRGVRYIGLSHFSANEACCPAKGKGMNDDQGLTEWGRELVARCEKLGVIVDLAHINRKGFMEACALATKPVIVSHTGVKGAHEHWRNIDDAQIRAVADSGGVIGVIFSPAYLGGDGLGPVIRHMHHIINVGGEDCLALGSDYDGMIVPTDALGDASQLPNLTDAMMAADWTLFRIEKALRGNVMRVLRDVPPKA